MMRDAILFLTACVTVAHAYVPGAAPTLPKSSLQMRVRAASPVCIFNLEEIQNKLQPEGRVVPTSAGKKAPPSEPGEAPDLIRLLKGTIAPLLFLASSVGLPVVLLAGMIYYGNPPDQVRERDQAHAMPFSYFIPLLTARA